ncbi:MAG: hypothetical protein ACLRL6_19310 [Clostridium sp.]
MDKSNGSIYNKVVIVTGGAMGIGDAMVFAMPSRNRYGRADFLKMNESVYKAGYPE